MINLVVVILIFVILIVVMEIVEVVLIVGYLRKSVETSENTIIVLREYSEMIKMRRDQATNVVDSLKSDIPKLVNDEIVRRTDFTSGEINTIPEG